MHTVTRTAAARAAARAQATRAAARDARGRAARDGCAASTVGAARRASADAIFKLACLEACLLACFLGCRNENFACELHTCRQLHSFASRALARELSASLCQARAMLCAFTISVAYAALVRRAPSAT